jgi:predicted metal-dependent hydrolase
MSTPPYRLRRSDSALHLRILVDSDGVEVVAPNGVDPRKVELFVQSKRPWIEKTLNRLKVSEAEFPPPLLEDMGQLPYLGERLVLRVSTEPGRQRAHVARRGQELHVRLGRETPLREAVEAWLRRQARTEVAARLDAAVARVGRSYSKLQIRGQRTRWASCSSGGAMSFNWRLLLAPPEILDYVVEHEVAHLDVQDHSARFWRLLGSRCPDWRDHEAWLRRHGHALRL